MAGIVEQLVEEVVEKAYSRKIYVIIPDKGVKLNVKCFFTEKAANEYYEKMKTIVSEEYRSLPAPHKIYITKMNENPFEEEVKELFVGKYLNDIENYRHAMNRIQKQLNESNNSSITYRKHLGFIFNIGLFGVLTPALICGLHYIYKKGGLTTTLCIIGVDLGISFIGFKLLEKTNIGSLIINLWNKCVDINWKFCIWLNRK